ncbi:MAG: LysR family transcriptional regulator [Lachnospiraceae bacterium]
MLSLCADAGSFSEAASVLYTTQSSVSKVIRALEEEMQASLFVRNLHGISLTQKRKTGICLCQPGAGKRGSDGRAVRGGRYPVVEYCI